MDGLARGHFAGDQERITDTIMVLLNANADPKGKGPNGVTLLHLAAMTEYSNIVHKLVTKGVSVNSSTDDGKTPAYFWFSGKKTISVMHTLLNDEADLGFIKGASADPTAARLLLTPELGREAGVFNMKPDERVWVTGTYFCNRCQSFWLMPDRGGRFKDVPMSQTIQTTISRLQYSRDPFMGDEMKKIAEILRIPRVTLRAGTTFSECPNCMAETLWRLG